MFPNEHPTYVTRRLEARMTRLNNLEKALGDTDPADGAAMKEHLLSIVAEMRELTIATGILTGRVGRIRT